MDSKEAVTFLTKLLTRKALLHDRTTTTELLHELTSLPLAIAQATAYFNAMQISIQDYLFRLRNTEQDAVNLLSREFRDETLYRNSKNSVGTTWLVSRGNDPTNAELQVNSVPRCLGPRTVSVI